MFRKLLTICLVLLFCTSAAHATKIASADDSTAIAVVDTNVDSLIILTQDILASHKVAGDVFYVNSNADGTDDGTSWTNAALTIEAGLALCTDAAGDWIFVHPAHAETASTGTFDLDKEGVTLWGIGNSTLMPTISYDTTTDTCLIGADGDGVKVHGIKFIATISAVANAITAEAGCTDFVIENCKFENETAGTDEFIDTIIVAGTASDRGIIRNNVFVSDTSENSGPQSSINFIDCDYIQIYGNKIFGDHAVAGIQNETTASNFVSIHDNEIHVGAIGDAKLDTTPAVTLVATTTGFVYDNIVATNVASPDLAIVAADCHVFGNRYSEVQGSTLEVGKVYTMSSATLVSGATDNIFTVAGGRIEIISMFGECTTNMGTVGATDIYVDATAGSDYDADMTTAVDIDALGVGDVIRLTNAIDEGVIDLTANMAAGQPLSWYCPAGIIILDPTTTDTGAITWWMTFRPLQEGVTVTVGP